MSLLDTILGALGGGGGGMPPDMMPPDPRDMSINGAPPPPAPPMFPGGLPMPMPRPPEAGPGMTTMPSGMDGDGSMPPGAPLNLGGGAGPSSGGGGGLAAALGLNPDVMRRVSAGLAGGLSTVGTQPFAGQAFANGLGGSLTGIDKSDQQDFKHKLEALDRALKLKGIESLGAYREDLSDAKFGKLDIDKQRADSYGQRVQDQGRIGQQNADTNASVAPSRVALNNSRIGLNEARTTESKEKIDGNYDPSIRLRRADDSSNRWYRDRIAPLRDEMRQINADYSLNPQQKAAKLADIQSRAAALDQEYQTVKSANRKAHGLNDDGTPVPRAAAPATGQGAIAKPPATPGSEISVKGDGSRSTPYEPQSDEDYNDIPDGAHYLNPADGSLRVKGRGRAQ